MAKKASYRNPDWLLLAIVVVLLVIGLTMVYSATFALNPDRPALFLTRQVLWVAVGSLLLALLAVVDYRFWRRFSVPLMAVTLALLVAVLLAGGERFGGRRWLMGGSFQPSELCKLTLILYIADWLSSKGSKLRRVDYGLIPFAIIIGGVAGLIVRQPDYSTAGLIAATALTMFFIAGADILQAGAISLIGGGVFGLLIWKSPHAWARIQSFLEFLRDSRLPQSAQAKEALAALISGGLVGRGPGQSSPAIFAPHTDTIFAVLGMEWGLVGCLIVIGLFAALGYRGFKIAREAPDDFGVVLATGLTCSLLYQAFLHVAVMVQIMPFTGVTLPFISYGGSSMLHALGSVGLLLSISRVEGASRRRVGKEAERSATYDFGGWHRRPRLSRSRRR